MSNLKCGLLSAIISTIVYAIIIALIYLGARVVYVFYAFIGCPLVFTLFFFLGYSLKAGYLKFLKPSRIHEAYDNPVDNYFSSEFDKKKGSVILAVICFVPTLLFYMLFSWIFFLRNR